MAPSFAIYPEAHVVRMSYQAPATFQEWERTMNAIIRDDRFRPGYNFLIDRTGVPAPSAVLVERMATWIQVHATDLGEGFRSAAVVSDPVSYGMMRMIQGLSGAPGIRVFRSLAEAEAWLDSSESADLSTGVA
jgi:hypothetical protein